jgi:hypothetical protein
VAKTLRAFATPAVVQDCVADFWPVNLLQQVGIAPLLKRFAELRPVGQRHTILKTLEHYVDALFAGAAWSLLPAISQVRRPPA